MKQHEKFGCSSVQDIFVRMFKSVAPKDNKGLVQAMLRTSGTLLASLSRKQQSAQKSHKFYNSLSFWNWCCQGKHQHKL